MSEVIENPSDVGLDEDEKNTSQNDGAASATHSGFAFDSLESIRKKLLDLSGRNKLLNFRHPKASCIRIIDELPNQIYSVLSSNKSFIFIPVPEPSTEELIEKGYIGTDEEGNEILLRDYPTAEQWAKEIGLETSHDLPDASVEEKGDLRHNDTNLQTLLYASELESRLRSIRRKSQTAIEECGSNILYLAIGFLEWYESRESDVKRMAPLFTLPVQLERTKLDPRLGVYRYKLTLTDEGLLTNITLREKLSNDFDLILSEIDEEVTPELYFNKIANTVIANQKRWKIRRQVSLVLLDFSKQVMYQDLDPNNWPDDCKIDDHPIIQMFFNSESADYDKEESASYYPEYEIDNVVDVHTQFPLIYDADSSQHSALIDAVNGENIVIEGPPGTGKSQTITNLIAASIANGQKVLFVAEKMAALNVVKARLDKAGLGDFCLEVHSHKTNKVKILQDLVARYSNQNNYRQQSSISDEIARYENLKEKLVDYVETINSEWKSTGLTIHKILNKATRFREEYGINPEKLRMAGVSGEEYTSVKQKEMIDNADMLGTIYEEVSRQAPEGNIINHYWYGVGSKDLKSYQIEDIKSALDNWIEKLTALTECWRGIVQKYRLGINHNSQLEEIAAFLGALQKLPNLNGRELLSSIDKISARNTDFRQLLDRYEILHKNINDISKIVKQVSIDERETINELNFGLNIFKCLGVDFSASIESVKNDVINLVELERLVDRTKSQYDKIIPTLPDALKQCFEISTDGLAEFEILISLINRLPQELWRYRDESFDNPDLDSVLQGLYVRYNNLRPKYNEVVDYFSIHRLPDSEVLEKHYAVMKNAGFFKYFSSEWRCARQLIISLLSDPKSNKKILLKLLPVLIEYKSGIEKIEKINTIDPLLQQHYKDMETPIDQLIKVRSWYKSIRNEYGIGFGERVGVGRDLLNLDRNIALALSDVANQELTGVVSKINNIIDSLRKRYVDYKHLQFGSSSLYDDKEIIAELKGSINKGHDALTKHLLTESISLDDVKQIKGNLLSLQNQVAEWEESDAVRYFTPDIIPLSEKAGSFSKNHLEAGLDTLKIADILSSNYALLNSLSSEPTEHFYNQLRGEKKGFDACLSASKNDENIFAGLCSLNYLEWIESTDGNVESLIERNKYALSKPEWLNTWCDYIRIRDKLCSQGLGKIINHLEAQEISVKDLRDIVDLVIHHQLSEEIFEKNSKVSLYSGLEQMAVRTKFQEYDRKLMKLQRERIAYQASRTKTVTGICTGKVSNYTEMSLIKHEANKKSRHVAVRKLFSRAPISLQALKPCFMMSPMSVAQYLEAGEFDFDLVVMDEASQIRPEDSIGSVRRGKRLVVVGDPKQLPPTSFFMKALNDDDDSENVGVEDSESILESVIPMFKTRRLRWHYRSRHESLIAFSNKHFYDENLIIFPSPFQVTDEFGIKFKRVTRGRFHNRRNVEEAREIVAAVSKHLEQNPDESIGVVAMSSEQRDEIERQLEQYLKDDALLSKAYEKNTNAEYPLFIKNLENVQGDERDVIVISMTYGPENVGGKTMQRFGPINSNVGWRRLNVLFTRSKKRMHIFSSMGSADVLADEKSNKGKLSLKRFLEYCETGHLHHVKYTGKPADSDFEIAVMRKLAEHGYECEPQLGVAGYFLDLAVRDPGNPGKFLMGVECDGATYHSAKSTRDRDRLRQEILEGLGWKIRRIWSTDWFKNPEAQLRPILEELEKIKTPVREVIEEEKTEEIVQASEVAKETAVEFEQTELLPDDESVISLEDRLRDFDENVIHRKFPGTEPNRRLLRGAMIEAILHHLPCSKSEFLELIPGYLRKGTEPEEAKKYLDSILEIVADYG